MGLTRSRQLRPQQGRRIPTLGDDEQILIAAFDLHRREVHALRRCVDATQQVFGPPLELGGKVMTWRPHPPPLGREAPGAAHVARCEGVLTDVEDLAAIAAMERLSDLGTGVRLLANVFDAPLQQNGDTVPVKGLTCRTLDALKAASSSSTLPLAAVTTVRGFKSACWRVALTPAVTHPYDYVWLRDSDVLVDPHLFSLREVEHWMQLTGAAVAQPRPPRRASASSWRCEQRHSI